MELFQYTRQTKINDAELWLSMGAALALVVGAWALLHEFSTPARLAEQRAEAGAIERRMAKTQPDEALAPQGAQAMRVLPKRKLPSL